MTFPLTNTTPTVDSHPQLHNGYVDAQAHFGCVGNGLADDTVAMQAAIDAVTSGTGVVTHALYIPPGAYRITSTLTVSNRALVMWGAGIGNAADSGVPGMGTTIFWDGSAGSPLLSVSDSRHLYVRDIFFEGKTSANPSEIVFFDGTSGTHGTNELIVFDQCRFGAGFNSTRTADGAQAATIGVRFGGTNQNNDQFRFSNCVFHGCATSFQLDNSQSIWGMLDNCFFQRATAAGVQVAASVNILNPTFNRCGVDISATSTAKVAVYGWWSENADLFADISGSGARLEVFGGQLSVKATYATANMIQVGSAASYGGLVLHGVWFNDPSAHVPKIYVRGTASSNAAYITVRGCPQLLFSQFDIQAGAGSGGLILDLDGRDYHVRRRLASSLALSLATMESAGEAWVSQSAALATGATDGFLYIPTCAGTPSGTPTAKTGTVPIIYDTSNNKLYVYNGGWKGGTVPGTFS